MSDTVSITVYGTARPAGSKKHVGRGIIVDAGKHTAKWKRAVRKAAKAAMQGLPQPLFIERPLEMSYVFYRARPKYHYGTGRNSGMVKQQYLGAYPITTPDLTKIVRATEDALLDVVYDDDARVVTQHNDKRYGDPERVEITIREVLS